MAFADIDRSLPAGVSIKGKSWGRANDTIGIGGLINGLSRANTTRLGRRRFGAHGLAAGAASSGR